MLHIRMRWLIAAVALLATLATSLLAGPALHTTLAASNRPQEYLALGDSVAFGFNPLKDPTNADNFIGYPTPVAAAIKENLTNAACPGETSTSFISFGVNDNGCKPYREAQFPLHVPYSSATESQLQFTDAFLQSHPKTLVVSIDIGANDLFLLVNACGGKVEEPLTPAQIQCIFSGLHAVLATLSANLDTIYGHIRNDDGYKHKLVALTYYSLNYSDPNITGAISQVNQVVADRTLAWGGIVADGFGAFAAASSGFGGNPCAAGLLIEVSSSPLTCNIHPSYPGDNGLESHANTGSDVLGQAIVNALRPD